MEVINPADGCHMLIKNIISMYLQKERVESKMKPVCFQIALVMLVVQWTNKEKEFCSGLAMRKTNYW